jgi:hypothetical protein
MGDLYINIRQVFCQSLSLKDAMIRQGGICYASTDLLAGSK